MSDLNIIEERESTIVAIQNEQKKIKSIKMMKRNSSAKRKSLKNIEV